MITGGSEGGIGTLRGVASIIWPAGEGVRRRLYHFYSSCVGLLRRSNQGPAEDYSLTIRAFVLPSSYATNGILLEVSAKGPENKMRRRNRLAATLRTAFTLFS